MALEDKIEDKESKGFIRKAFDLGFNLAVAGATTLLSTAFVGPLGIYVGGGVAVGDIIGGAIKKKSLYEIVNNSLKGYSTINAILHPIIWIGDVTLPLIPNETLLGKAARAVYAMTGWNAAFTAAFEGTHHLISNKFNPKGLYYAVTDNFYNKWKRTALGFAPAYAFVANGVYTLGELSPHIGKMPEYLAKIPLFAANAVPFVAYNVAKPLTAKSLSYSSHYSPTPATAH